MSTGKTEANEKSVLVSRSPSLTRNFPPFDAPIDLDDVNHRLDQKPDRSWTSRYTRSESSTPNVTPPPTDYVERYRGDVMLTNAMLWTQGSRADYRMSIDDADYWMKETLHWRQLLEDNQANIKDRSSYWKNQALSMFRMRKEHAIPACRVPELRFDINDADYWKAEAQHLNSIYYGRTEDDTEPSKAQETDTEVINPSPKVQAPKKSGTRKRRQQGSARQSRHSGWRKDRRTMALPNHLSSKRGPVRQSKRLQRSNNTASVITSDQPISSRLRSSS
ncbi:hypothetical protein MMC28_011194 [Mycoblastus sanguinarius]|nr:hypothetical protein [Mycoblastus sanguinarius]